MGRKKPASFIKETHRSLLNGAKRYYAANRVKPGKRVKALKRLCPPWLIYRLRLNFWFNAWFNFLLNFLPNSLALREAKPERACLSCCPALQNIFAACAGGGKAGRGGKRLRFAWRRLRGQGGFSIVGMMVASALGITILTGTTQLFVEMSQKINRIEKRQQKQLFYAYIRKHFEKPENCKLTLNAKKGTGSVKHYYAAADAANKDLDGDASTPDDHQYKIGRLLMPDNTNKPDDTNSLPDIKIDFYPTSAADKKDIKQRLRNKWGIESLGGGAYVHDTTDGPYLSVVTNRLVHGVIPVPDKPFKIPLNIKTEAAASPHKGEMIKTCSAGPIGGGGTPCGGPGAPHPNGGGFVEETAEVAATVFVGPNAKVCDLAWVYENARIEGNASVYWQAHVAGSAKIYDNAKIYGNARIWGDARIGGAGVRVFDDAHVYKNSRVYGNAWIYGRAKIHSAGGSIDGSAQVYDDAQVYGTNVYVSGGAKIYNKAHVFGKAWAVGAQVYGEARVFQNARLSGSAQVRDRAQVYGNGRVYGSAQIYNYAKVYRNGRVGSSAEVFDRAEVQGGFVLGSSKIYGSAKIKGGMRYNARIDSGSHY